ncbi:Di-copper centre-containing protein [Penicillium argentinense]|uniref:Di-copper centre-containing protein n=1 Tax=Penicillium argentinense TaxID=1131581 RepID=A0A9W9EXD0_9EURO|nr:Di-copper centre-containing protein [Penicillium argentinense]KAJ5089768.1 Di-copper centre-containing protein [Penicillium argentinense]
MVAAKILAVGLVSGALGGSIIAEKAHLQLQRLAEIARGVAISHVAHGPLQHEGCTQQALSVRRDWRAFTRREKKAYINSVLCLQKLPSQTPHHLAPGTRSRYDDFVATHINQTLEIHYTGTFLAWHRYFIWTFEQALRNECGYTGDYPYWDWGADVDAMEKSPVFDGSDTSLSGNGAYIPKQPEVRLSLEGHPDIFLPAGTGGGCVTSGPFKNYTISMGPADLVVPGRNVSTRKHPLTYNPRCLRRDLTSAILRKFNTYPDIVNLIVQSKDVWDFEMLMQGFPDSGLIGVHGGGHFSMGGDPGRDVYVSPGDPAFWHHHNMIDRVWWIWQNLDLKNRQYDISGTGTFLNVPPTPNTTLETVINVGYAGGDPIAMKNIMSTTAGPFCYIYL